MKVERLMSSPVGRLQKAAAESAPLLRKYLRMIYLIALILLPARATRMLAPLIRPLKSLYEHRR